MWVPLLVAIASVCIGASLAVLPGVVRHALGPARTFALAAAVTVVGVHLLPEATSSLGGLAFAALALGLAVPALGERLAVRVMGAKWGVLERGTVAVHVSFAGLLVHQIGDGMGLWVFAGGARPDLDVALALGAHTVPLTMLVVLAPLSAGHRGLAFARAAALAIATTVGVLLGMLVPATLVERVEPWTASIVAGLLLHVLWHDVRQNAPRTGRERSVDILAAAAGVALAGLGTLAHGEVEHGLAVASSQSSLAATIAELALEVAPVLLLGLVIGAVVQTLGGRIPDRWLRGGGTLAQAARGALLGAPSPICACGVLPVTRSLEARGASVALAVAFLLATPGLGADTFALTARLLGVELAVVRVLGVVAVSIVGAVVVARFARAGRVQAGALPVVEVASASARRPALARFVTAMSELSRHTGPWMVVGVVAAAYTDVLVAPGALAAPSHSVLYVLLVSVLAIPGYVCAAAATPLAAVLVAKGLSPGAALVGLVLGPALNVTTLVFLGRGHGRRAVGLGLVAMLAVGLGLALALDALGPAVPALDVARAPARPHDWLSLGSAAVLGAWLLFDVWRIGVRGWLASLADGADPVPETPDSHGEHVHGPGCGHTHALTPPRRALRSRA